jgi:hypothetical protein
MIIKSTIFSDVTLCSLVGVYQRFDPEGVGSKFPQNIGIPLLDWAA